mmetsp:Transcript_30915/g.66933  ORF Transcript_30915/g.66933 Transcript_30915/m.66933 type:complete len:170 (+) Transcript_30915:134-643(+)
MSNPGLRNRHRSERSALLGEHEDMGAADSGGGRPTTGTTTRNGQAGSGRRRHRTRAPRNKGAAVPPPTGAQEASNIVESLMRTKSAMKQDLERISHVTDAIDSDGAMLKDTKESHQGLSGLAKGAKGALRYLQAQERREDVVLWAAVIFFFLSAAYVFWTRVRIPFLLW